jgi:hypothetical protein
VAALESAGAVYGQAPGHSESARARRMINRVMSCTPLDLNQIDTLKTSFTRTNFVRSRTKLQASNQPREFATSPSQGLALPRGFFGFAHVTFDRLSALSFSS